MQKRVCKLIKMKPPVAAGNGLLFASGDTVPTDEDTGYQTSCIFQHTDGGIGTAFYINEGDEDSCAFVAVAGLTVAQEALLGATAGVATASKALILDASGEVTSGTLILGDGNMAAGTGVTTASGGYSYYRVTKVGDLFKTEILLDITGLNDGDTAADVVGKDGDTVNCHIGQINAAINGTIIAGRMTCLEVPATGHVDLDLWTANDGDLAQDVAISTATGEVQLVEADSWADGDMIPFDAFPPDEDYLILVTGSQGSDKDYTGGQFLIELWGV